MQQVASKLERHTAGPTDRIARTWGSLQTAEKKKFIKGFKASSRPIPSTPLYHSKTRATPPDSTDFPPSPRAIHNDLSIAASTSLQLSDSNLAVDFFFPLVIRLISRLPSLSIRRSLEPKPSPLSLPSLRCQSRQPSHFNMAFNFNWSPLTADERFYERARDLLTTALNKSPKPPIIVDDILVTEFNLGSVPPDLEILEIGDLAEDRFRGIFKMCYSGDAFLTLKTRVQANPLNTYLSAKPSFTSPQPLAAASSLTIPLQITLSEIKLSAFIILVFSKQKGLTIVFRNDPLESLKVSSTFDSIQFVRDYLQRTIEGKLRDLFMDELPAIIHRLSLQLWCPDQIPKEGDDLKEDSEPAAVNPLATPPLDAVDSNGHRVDPTEIPSLSLDGNPEIQSLFSQKNLMGFAGLSNITSSLFPPALGDSLFRAWAGQSDRVDTNGSPLSTPSLQRSASYTGTPHTYTFSDSGTQENSHFPSRPSLVSLNSATTGLSLGAGRHPKTGRKKKTRVVNLRKKKDDSSTGVTTSATTSEAGDTASETVSTPGAMSEPIIPGLIVEEPEEELANKVRFSTLPREQPIARSPLAQEALKSEESSNLQREVPITLQQQQPQSTRAAEKAKAEPIFMSADSTNSQKQWKRGGPQSDTSSVILEQALIMKMAGEIARRVYDEKSRNPSFWEDREDSPPPAYEAS